MNTPNLGTIEVLALELNVHPLTIVALTYATATSPEAVDQLLKLVSKEVESLNLSGFVPANRRRKVQLGRRM